MMKSHQDIRRWSGALLLAVVPIWILVPTASATSEKPEPGCPPAEQQLIAALDTEMQALVARREQLAETVELWREGEAIESRRDIARFESLRAVAALDRGLDALELRHWQQEWSTFAGEKASAKPHAIRAGLDVLVSLARVPARAALVARHLIEAFAKVTPRVVRVLS